MDPFTTQEEMAWSMPSVKTAEKSLSVVAGISTRLNGVSSAPFSSLNMAFHVNDEPSDVKENRIRLGKALNFEADQWTGAVQIHKDRIERVTATHRGLGALDYSSALPDTDGLYTTEPNLLLTMNYADCVPLYFYSIKNEVVGIAHAGWRGTVMNIGGKMVREWDKIFSVNTNDIQVMIGPSIGKCCYEVDESVMNEVRHVHPHNEEAVAINTKKGKYQLDLKELNRRLLIEEGIPAGNINVSDVCTSCSNHLFFSHRKDGGKTGRMIGFIGLRRR